MLNDVHSGLSPTCVAALLRPRSLEELQEAVRMARGAGAWLSISGGRHAMGGQPFATGALHVDADGLDRVLGFERERGRIEVEAGLRWPALCAALRRLQPGPDLGWGIAQKQTGANELSLGGAVSANVHGRGLCMRPFAADVEDLVLVDPEGRALRASRTENSDLFALALGGYGLFGLVYSVRLRLAPRSKLVRRVELRCAEGLIEAFEQRIRRGALYGDFQFEIDPRSRTFLTRGILSCYEPVDPLTPVPRARRELRPSDWMRLLCLAHADKRAAFESYSRRYLATDGQVYLSDEHQLAHYPEGYHAELDRRLAAPRPGSEMITELFVPRGELHGFLRSAARELRRREADVVYGTVRLIERDEETFLAWARERWACVVLNLHVDHTPSALAAARSAFRALIDLARERGGSFYLTYHRWATRSQLAECHPRLVPFLREKLRRDPREILRSDWYLHLAQLFRGAPPRPRGRPATWRGPARARATTPRRSAAPRSRRSPGSRSGSCA